MHKLLLSAIGVMIVGLAAPTGTAGLEAQDMIGEVVCELGHVDRGHIPYIFRTADEIDDAIRRCQDDGGTVKGIVLLST